MVLTILLCSPAWSQASKQRLVSLSFHNTDLVQTLRILAKTIGAKAQIGPGVQGSVTIELEKIAANEAIRQILALQEQKFDYRLLSAPELTLVVDTPEALASIPKFAGGPEPDEVRLPANSIRMEYLLEEAPAAMVVDFLKDEYSQVEFTLHPTLNGFYASGSREDLLQIKRELGHGGRAPGPPPPPLRERLPVRHGDIHEIRSRLKELVPDVVYNIDLLENVLTVEGPPGAIDMVREMFVELDRPEE